MFAGTHYLALSQHGAGAQGHKTGQGRVSPPHRLRFREATDLWASSKVHCNLLFVLTLDFTLLSKHSEQRGNIGYAQKMVPISVLKGTNLGTET